MEKLLLMHPPSLHWNQVKKNQNRLKVVNTYLNTKTWNHLYSTESRRFNAIDRILKGKAKCNQTEDARRIALLLLPLTTRSQTRKRIKTQLLSCDRSVRSPTLLCHLQPTQLTRLTSTTKNARNKTSSPQTIVVRGNRVGNTCRIRIGINNTDSRHIVKPALMQQDNILKRVKANYQVRLERRAISKIRLEVRQFLVQRVDNLSLTVTKNLLAVRQRARNPALEDVVALCQRRRLNNGPLLTLPCTGEEDKSAACGDFLNYFCGAAEVSGCYVQRDDVHTLTDTEDVSRVLWVPA